MLTISDETCKETTNDKPVTNFQKQTKVVCEECKKETLIDSPICTNCGKKRKPVLQNRICNNCGHQYSEFMNKCEVCGNMFVQFSIQEAASFSVGTMLRIFEIVILSILTLSMFFPWDSSYNERNLFYYISEFNGAFILLLYPVYAFIIFFKFLNSSSESGSAYVKCISSAVILVLSFSILWDDGETFESMGIGLTIWITALVLNALVSFVGKQNIGFLFYRVLFRKN